MFKHVPFELTGDQNTLAELEPTIPQKRALEALEDKRQRGVVSGYLDMATGTGKTFTIAKDLQRLLEDDPSLRALWLCHRGTILEQNRKMCEAILQGTVTHGNIFEGQCEDSAQIVYATFQSLSNDGIYQALSPNEFDYVVIDESHHSPAPTYAPIIEHFTPQVSKIGLTATAERRDMQPLEPLLGEKIYTCSLPEAIANGYLVKPDYRLYTEHEKGVKSLVKKIGAVSLNEINQLFKRVTNNEEIQLKIAEEIVETMLEFDDPRAVIYCPNIDYAEKFATLLPGCRALHSKLDKDEQRERLEAFRRGYIPSITAVNQMSEGIDVPEINTVVFLRSTESKVVFLQEFGRGLRKAPGKDKVVILDYAINWERIRLVSELKDEVERLANHGGYIEENDHSHSSQDLDKGPFSFTFSQTTLNAIDVLKRSEGEKKKPREIRKPRSEKWQETDTKICKMLHINPNELPNQRVTERDWAAWQQRLDRGDEDVIPEMIQRRLRSLYMHAERAYHNQPPTLTLSVEDHFQALIEHSLDKLRSGSNKNIKEKFTWLSHQYTPRYLGSATTVHTPAIFVEKVHERNKALAKLERKQASFVREEDVVKECGIEFNEYERILVKQLYEEGFGSDELLKDLIDESPESDPVQLVFEIMRRQAIEKVLRGNLTHQERRVIELRYGLEQKNEKKTLDEVGKILSRSRERIRQIETHSLKKLQSSHEILLAVQDAGDSPFVTYSLKQLIDRYRQAHREIAEIQAKGEEPSALELANFTYALESIRKHHEHEKNLQRRNEAWKQLQEEKRVQAKEDYAKWIAQKNEV